MILRIQNVNQQLMVVNLNSTLLVLKMLLTPKNLIGAFQAADRIATPNEAKNIAIVDNVN